MGRNEDRPVAAQPAEDPPEPDPLLGVQPDRGLVHNEELRVGEDGLGDPEPTHHASREGARSLMAHVGEPHILKGLIDPVLPCAGPVQPTEPRAVIQELGGRELRIGTEMLGQVTQAPADLHAVLLEIPVIDPYPALRGHHLRGEDLDQGRLSGAVGSEQSEGPVADLEAQIREGRGEAPPVDLGDV